MYNELTSKAVRRVIDLKKECFVLEFESDDGVNGYYNSKTFIPFESVIEMHDELKMINKLPVKKSAKKKNKKRK